MFLLVCCGFLWASHFLKPWNNMLSLLPFDKLVFGEFKIADFKFYWNCLLNSVAKSLIEKVLLVDKGDILADLHIEIFISTILFKKEGW